MNRIFHPLLILFSIAALINSQNLPFPQHLNFQSCIKPSGISQSSMDSTVATFYDTWKKRYIKHSTGGAIGDGFYVNMKGTGGTGTEVTTSEAHGYGMIVFALMASYDDSAKIYYDGMLNLFDKHRSTINKNLMSWVIDPVSGDQDGATDGDMDIAYSLLLADKQWGSNGIYNYLKKADTLINKGIKGSDIRTSGSKRTTLGDWDDNPYNTRPSDWMTDHFKTFASFTGDNYWLEAADTVYSLISQITSAYSSSTGLMPDFVVGSSPKPAAPNFLEDITDGDYAWNACRFPWRMAVDFAHFGTPQAKVALGKILSWLKTKTNGDPSNITAGYKLDGSAGRDADGIIDYPDMVFTAPFITACVADASNQEYLNKGWKIITKAQGDYYGDSIDLLCLLLITGNWWKSENSSSQVFDKPCLVLPEKHMNYSAVLKNSVLKFAFELPGAGNARAELVDCTGRSIKIFDGKYGMGKHSIQNRSHLCGNCTRYLFGEIFCV